MSNFSRFLNNAELEALQKAISFISPSLRLEEFILTDTGGPLPRAKAVTLRLKEKGNKLTIANLQNLGFRRLRKEGRKVRPWDPFTETEFVIVLKKDL